MMSERAMNSADMTRSSNEWMRRYIEEPEKFTREFQTIQDFLTDEAAGREPSYGELCTAYQFKLLEEINAATVVA
jgi:hypothetical protein